jgi:anti-sigma regulatory factor (Ser/Thr protein kinase)
MPAVTETHHVAPDLAEVERLNALLSQSWVERELPPEQEMPVTLALEEILSNVIRHNAAAGAAEISARFTFEPAAFELEVVDNGHPFNPLELPPLDPAAPLEDRRPGGMGVFILRQLADELRYEYRDGRNRLVFRKNWQPSA